MGIFVGWPGAVVRRPSAAAATAAAAPKSRVTNACARIWVLILPSTCVCSACIYGVMNLVYLYIANIYHVYLVLHDIYHVYLVLHDK